MAGSVVLDSGEYVRQKEDRQVPRVPPRVGGQPGGEWSQGDHVEGRRCGEDPEARRATPAGISAPAVLHVPGGGLLRVRVESGRGGGKEGESPDPTHVDGRHQGRDAVHLLGGDAASRPEGRREKGHLPLRR
eukprot:6860406-Pyramimonas_sp.AAC.1